VNGIESDGLFAANRKNPAAFREMTDRAEKVG